MYLFEDFFDIYNQLEYDAQQIVRRHLINLAWIDSRKQRECFFELVEKKRIEKGFSKRNLYLRLSNEAHISYNTAKSILGRKSISNKEYDENIQKVLNISEDELVEYTMPMRNQDWWTTEAYEFMFYSLSDREKKAIIELVRDLLIYENTERNIEIE